jgi:DNA-binding transcriptional LysR family regulator
MHFLVAPAVVAATDYVVTLSERVALALDPALSLRRLPPPLELPGFSTVMAWHPRSSEDPAHRWLRGLALSVADGLGAGA